MTRLIAVVGGIGSGKSVVSRVLMAMGYPVYDSDSRAKRLMDNSPEIKQRIKNEISESAINSDGSINRRALADIVFSDEAALHRLNSIVHGAVRRDFAAWAQSQKGEAAFIETALLYQSGLDGYVDEVWEVESPLEKRLQRIVERDGCTIEHAQARIDSQAYNPEKKHPVVRAIRNDERHSILLQVGELLRSMPTCSEIC